MKHLFEGKMTMNDVRARLVSQGKVVPTTPRNTIDPERQNRITRKLSRVNAILARRTLTTH